MTNSDSADRDLTPPLVTKLARDIRPHYYALWCTVGGVKEPFANEIVLRRLEPDGSITFMLESHNFMFAAPDEEVHSLVELSPKVHAATERMWREHDRKAMRGWA